MLMRKSADALFLPFLFMASFLTLLSLVVCRTCTAIRSPCTRNLISDCFLSSFLLLFPCSSGSPTCDSVSEKEEEEASSFTLVHLNHERRTIRWDFAPDIMLSMFSSASLCCCSFHSPLNPHISLSDPSISLVCSRSVTIAFPLSCGRNKSTPHALHAIRMTIRQEA